LPPRPHHRPGPPLRPSWRPCSRAAFQPSYLASSLALNSRTTSLQQHDGVGAVHRRVLTVGCVQGG
jgi:hypothetical protein